MAKPYSAFRHYAKKKPQPPIQVGDKFHRLTVVEILPAAKDSGTKIHVCRCECSVVLKTSAQSLRKGYVSACKACTALEKKLAGAIAAAKEMERLTSARADPAELPNRPKWEYVPPEER